MFEYILKAVAVVGHLSELVSAVIAIALIAGIRNDEHH
jgi:hypothetical protein